MTLARPIPLVSISYEADMNSTARQSIPVLDPASIARRAAIRALLDAQLVAVHALHYMPPLGILPNAEEWRDTLAVFAAWCAEEGARLVDKRDAQTPHLEVRVEGEYFACLHIPDGLEEPDEPAWRPADGVAL